jgi:hypothetical protein
MGGGHDDFGGGGFSSMFGPGMGGFSGGGPMGGALLSLRYTFSTLSTCSCWITLLLVVSMCSFINTKQLYALIQQLLHMPACTCGNAMTLRLCEPMCTTNNTYIS